MAVNGVEFDLQTRLKDVNRTKINLKRLLNRCEGQLSAGSGKVPDADVARFETFLGVARSHLDELKEARLLLGDGSDAETNEIASLVPSEEEITEFARKTQYLADLFGDMSVVHTSRTSHEKGTSSETQLRQRVRSRLVTDRRHELLGDEPAKPEPPANDEDNEESLRSHRREQEELTEDMLSLAADLKESSALMERIAHGDQKTLDDTAERASSNVDRISAEVTKVKEYSNELFKSTCTYWSLIILVSILFVGAYMMIKFTPSS